MLCHELCPEQRIRASKHLACHNVHADYTFEPRQSSGDDGSSSGSSGGDGGSGASKGSQPRWVGVPSNGAIPAHMARQLAAQHPSSFQLQSGCAVQSMERLGGGCGSPTRWRLHGSLAGQEPAELGDYDAVILADAAPLLPGSPGYVEGLEAASSSLAQLARSVQAVSYQPRFTLTVAFAAPLPGVPFDFASVEDSGGARACGSCGCGACGSISGGAFQGVACNSSKPGRPGSGSDTSSSSGGGSADGPQCWVGVSTAQRAQQLVEQLSSRYDPQSEQYYAAVAEELLADFRDIMAPFVQVGWAGCFAAAGSGEAGVGLLRQVACSLGRVLALDGRWPRAGACHASRATLRPYCCHAVAIPLLGHPCPLLPRPLPTQRRALLCHSPSTAGPTGGAAHL